MRQGQRLNLVLVNQSGVDAQLTWKPAMYAADEVTTLGGCESKSIVVGAGGWLLTGLNLDVSSEGLNLPFTTRMLELEIWLEPDGSSRTVGPREVDHEVDAPYPSACATVP